MCMVSLLFVDGLVFVGCQILVENTSNGEERCHDACELPREGRMSRHRRRIDGYFSTIHVYCIISEHYLTVTLMLNLNFGNVQYSNLFSFNHRT